MCTNGQCIIQGITRHNQKGNLIWVCRTRKSSPEHSITTVSLNFDLRPPSHSSHPSTYEDYSASMPICKCDSCRNWTYKGVDGRRRRGRRLDAPTVTAHGHAARLQRKLERADSWHQQHGGATRSDNIDNDGDTAGDAEEVQGGSGGNGGASSDDETASGDDHEDRARQNALFMAAFAGEGPEEGLPMRSTIITQRKVRVHPQSDCLST